MGNVLTIREDGSKRVQYFCEGPSLTRQEFQDECDLGKIIARFSATPEGLEQLQIAQGYVQSRFDDVSEIPDYRTALDQVKRAEEAFLRLPPKVRTRFDNDPALFLDFIDNPANHGELYDMGLAERPIEPFEVTKPVKAAKSADSTPPVKG